MADKDFPLDGLADLTPEAWLAGMADISEGGGADFYDPEVDTPEEYED